MIKVSANAIRYCPSKALRSAHTARIYNIILLITHHSYIVDQTLHQSLVLVPRPK